MIRKTLKYLAFFLMAYTVFCLITPFSTTLRNRSIKNQISYLAEILSKGYDNQLQRRFPEGKIFSNALLALSTIEYCDNYDAASDAYAKIVDDCIRRIQSKKALETFDSTITPQYGMFYNGWSNFVYSSYKNSRLYAHSELHNEVESQSALIQKRLTSTLEDSIRLLDTYIEASWPADNLIGLVSLEDSELKEKWLTTILQSTEHSSGLVHHIGSDNLKVKGSSSALITFCLGEARYVDISKYNILYTKHFVRQFLGVQLVKENEDGSNDMDVDSGLVVWGFGASATIMNIKTQARLGHPSAKFTWAAMNVLALPVNVFGKKYYLLKQEPMLDLFLLWGCVEV